jgi:hypothetical protein
MQASKYSQGVTFFEACKWVGGDNKVAALKDSLSHVSELMLNQYRHYK